MESIRSIRRSWLLGGRCPCRSGVVAGRRRLTIDSKAIHALGLLPEYSARRRLLIFGLFAGDEEDTVDLESVSEHGNALLVPVPVTSRTIEQTHGTGITRARNRA
jgi:hypothetical protein